MDGKALAGKISAEVAKEVEELGPLGLATVLVGDDPASDVYVTRKHKDATEVGMRPIDKRLPADTAEADVLALVDELNADEGVDGLLVQTPVPDAPRRVQDPLLGAAGEGRRRLDAAERRAALPRPRTATSARRRSG